ncbi:BsuPI-related putative proteinase inhibitor [Desulforamulus ferrireducens]|uniref:Peptidoglycan-binding protein n=1 Tax=Desulforamulus ferrireducens TaxID=1833852 RepID=A0A1S6IU72_9FIRM|nr:BsuPI-related putative proteinase inhibitor [Desulforamulus ferrireducens]AQS58321.1 peptidoglycan-binding protein [Desulforamulus ferrireducens]
MAIYVVRSGDTLAAIAARYGLTLEQLLELNPQITDPNIILVGQEVTVPDQPGTTAPSPTTPPTSQAATNQSGAQAVLRANRNRINAVLEAARPYGAYATKVVDDLIYLLVLNDDEFRQGQRVRIRLYKINVSGQEIRLRYTTGQRLEIVVRDARNNEVWRYSRGRNFTQASGTVIIGRNAFAIYENNWDQENNAGRQVPTGRYTINVSNVARGYRDEIISIPIQIVGGVSPTTPPRPTPSPTPRPGQCTGQNLLSNPSFENWSSSSRPRNWSATNVVRTDEAYSGSYAALLGSTPNRNATLSQEIPILAGSNNRVSFRVAENVERGRQGNFEFGVQVLFRNRSGTVVGVAPQGPFSPALLEDERYELFSFTTGDVPRTAETAELMFTFNPSSGNRSRVKIDFVEFRCLSR